MVFLIVIYQQGVKLFMTYHSGNQLVDPQMLFEKSHLQPGMHVADLGCGRTGHIVFPAAQIIGERGVVYAIDILKDVLQNIVKRACINGMTNVHAIWADIEQAGHTSIPEKSIDVIFLINTLVQTKNDRAVLDEAARIGKDKVRIVLVDWVRSGLSFSPPEADFADFNDVRLWAQEKNFAVAEEFKAGPYHNGLILYRHE